MPEPIKTETGHSAAHLTGHDSDTDVALAKIEGWVTHYTWGRDGWDLGQAPYVLYATRALPDGTAQTRCYCEGDLTIKTFSSMEEAHADLDEAFLFHARRASWWDEDEYAAEPARFQGPFSWDRLKLEKWDKEASE